MFVEKEKIIKTLKNIKPIKLLFDNERNDKITNTGRCFFYLDKDEKYRCLPGLLPTLEKTYWSNTDINKITKKPSLKLTKKIKKPKIKSSKKGGRFGGTILGKKIHKQLEDFILLDKKNFRKIHNHLHSWTDRILRYIMSDMSLQPLQGEFMIYDETLRIGTSIDMICVNKEGKLIFFEFKTGYKDYFENNDGMMTKSLFFMKNSPLNWATIQLITSVIMISKSHSIPLNDTLSYIIRIDDHDLDCYNIPNSFIKKTSHHIYNDLFTSNNENIKK